MTSKQSARKGLALVAWHLALSIQSGLFASAFNIPLQHFTNGILHRRRGRHFHVAVSPESLDSYDFKQEDNSKGHEDSTLVTTGMSPLSMTVEDLSQILGGRGRALMVWDCLRQGIDPVILFESLLLENHDKHIPMEGMSTFMKLGGKGTTSVEGVLKLMPKKRRVAVSHGLGQSSLKKLKKILSSVEEDIARLSHISTSQDGTTKLLLKMASDGLEVETVIIPWFDRKSSTLCVSSQVGCRQGCTFCATGRMGKLRSLTSDEIVVQLYYANQIIRLMDRDLPQIDNIVFMGMGEPADNVDNVVRAARIFIDRQLFQLSQSKVTISTVAPTPESFRDLAQASVTLAWSVHAVNDKLRKSLVPTTKYTMQELRQGLVQALGTRTQQSLRTTMLEIALIDNVNDSPQDAQALAEFVKELVNEVAELDPTAKPVKLVVNLIPWNDIGNHPLGYQKPSVERVWAFQNILTDQDIYTFTRITRGDDESAACGQLATKKAQIFPRPAQASHNRDKL